MTSPQGFQATSALQSPSYSCLQVTGTAQSVGIAEALQAALQHGYTAGIDVSNQFLQNSTGVWRLRLTDPNGVDQFAYQGDWMVSTGSGLAFHTNAEFAANFTINCPLEWAAETTAPAATLNADGTVTLAFPQPTSANRPFTYTATGGGMVGQFATDANGNVTVTISGLAKTGTLGPWTVAVTTQYSTTPTPSLPSNTVTVPTPTPGP